VVTKRTPIRRPLRLQISAEAVRLFNEMERVECTCAPRDWDGEHWEHVPCAGCERWWVLNSELCYALALPPGHWPAYANPRAESPYPPDHANAKRATDPALVKVFYALRRAARETVKP
jgi:hypothetical protein